jgi:hypothetical protein
MPPPLARCAADTPRVTVRRPAPATPAPSPPQAGPRPRTHHQQLARRSPLPASPRRCCGSMSSTGDAIIVVERDGATTVYEPDGSTSLVEQPRPPDRADLHDGRGHARLRARVPHRPGGGRRGLRRARARPARRRSRESDQRQPSRPRLPRPTAPACGRRRRCVWSSPTTAVASVHRTAQRHHQHARSCRTPQRVDGHRSDSYQRHLRNRAGPAIPTPPALTHARHAPAIAGRCRLRGGG